jgi:ABC-type sugar transport system ATPase subunit
MNAQATPVLEVRAAVKRFGGVLALNEASLTLGRGEILALLGDNGAGKSTLIKSISGAYHLDGGQILVDGEPAAFKHSSDARSVGIETVYQDLALFDNLPATANFYAGREMVAPGKIGRGWGLLRERTMFTQTTQTLEKLRVRIPSLTLPVGLMSGGQRQAIAVARAVAFATKVVLLDEPTAALGLRESQQVLDLVRSLPQHGVSVILISHNLEHVIEVADRAVVLRRGRIVGEEIPTRETHERLVSLIVGGADTPTTNGRASGAGTPAHVPPRDVGSTS